MRVAFLPSNQTDNATALKYTTESDLQLPVAKAAAAYLQSRGHQAAVFHIPFTRRSDRYPKYPELFEMCRQAAQWEPDVVIINHSDSAGEKPAGILTLPDGARKRDKDYVQWTHEMHERLSGLIIRPKKRWEFDVVYIGFRYAFYSYLDKCGCKGWPLLIELANHSSLEDAQWLKNNAEFIGKGLGEATIQSYDYIKGVQDIMTPEQEAKLDKMLKSAEATSYRESILIAMLAGRWEEADVLYEEAKAKGITIRGYARPH